MYNIVISSNGLVLMSSQVTTSVFRTFQREGIGKVNVLWILAATKKGSGRCCPVCESRWAAKYLFSGSTQFFSSNTYQRGIPKELNVNGISIISHELHRLNYNMICVIDIPMNI